MSLEVILEATMLLCFGLAWPVANLRMLRTRRPEGKGLAFTLIILIGYTAGATAKWLSAGPGQPCPTLFWLYTANGASVMLNLLLQWYLGRRLRQPTLLPGHSIGAGTTAASAAAADVPCASSAVRCGP